VEEVDFEKSHFCTFQTAVSLILVLDQVIWHNVVYHSSTSNYILNFVQIQKVHGRTDTQAGRWTVKPSLLDQLDEWT